MELIDEQTARQFNDRANSLLHPRVSATKRDEFYCKR